MEKLKNIMKLSANFKIGIVFLICMQSYFVLFSQTDSIYYARDKYGYVKLLSENKIEFKLLQNGGLGESYVVGFGKYNLRKNKIIVKTEKYPIQLGSSYKILRTMPWDSAFAEYKIKVLGEATGQPIKGVTVHTGEDQSSRIEYTNSEGIAVISSKNFTTNTLINISFIGYQPIKIPMIGNTQTEVLVELREGVYNIVENKKVKIKYYIENNSFVIGELIK